MKLRSHAKINLYLDVLDRREDGFHNILTVFQTVDLCDTLTIENGAGDILLSCDTPQLDTGADNLIVKAARLLQAYSGNDQGARIHLEKRIPIAAGLAGGSGNAAATLVGLNSLWGLELDDAELANLGAQLGSDVPYCLKGGSMAAMDRGEVLTSIALPEDLWLVLVCPDLSVSTAWVYNHSDLPRATGPDAVAQKHARFQEAVGAFQEGEFRGHVYNGMEEVVFQEHPELRELKKQLLDAGCTAAAMSGSGPSLFGICSNEDQARQIASRIGDAVAVRSVDRGIVTTD